MNTPSNIEFQIERRLIEDLRDWDCDDVFELSYRYMESVLEYAEESKEMAAQGGLAEVLSAVVIFNLVAKYFDLAPELNEELVNRYRRLQASIREINPSKNGPH